MTWTWTQQLNWLKNRQHITNHRKGFLHWIVELGRIDIATEVSLLASYVALPRKQHLQTVFHIYAFLKKRHNSRLTLDPSYPDIDMRVFHQADWTDFYGDVKEAIPDNAPEPRGKTNHSESRL